MTVRSLAYSVFGALLLLGVGCTDSGTTPRPIDSGVIDTGRPLTDSGGGGTCSPGRTDCGRTCVLLDTNPAHCGACGNACGADETCASGMCRAAMTCPAGQDDCGEGCTAASCGDGFVGPGEGCDDGKDTPADGCDVPARQHPSGVRG